MDTITPDWSKLPGDLLFFIAKRLHSRGDTIRFRAVCNSFRSSVPPPKPLSPRSDLYIPFPCDSHPYSGGHFLLTHSTVYAIQPLTHTHETSKPWMVRAQEFNSSKVRVQNPLFATRFQMYFSENLPKSLNLLECRVKEISKAHHLELYCLLEGKPVLHFFSKVVVSTCYDETDDAFAIMTLHAVGTLLVWRNVDRKWTFINIPYQKNTDIIYHNKKFYVLVSTGFLMSVDPKSLTITEVANPVPDESLVPVYLLESLEDLLMIGNYSGFGTYRGNQHVKLNEFYVYKLDDEKCEWVRVREGLEKRLLFLNEDHSFSVSTEEFPGWGGNSVYYTYYDFTYLINNHPGMSVGVFNLKEGYDVPNLSESFLPPPDWLE